MTRSEMKPFSAQAEWNEFCVNDYEQLIRLQTLWLIMN